MKKVRCAVYTRKSSEDGLEQAFNSLHAQREACVSYIASQKHEGWVLLPEQYDDGGVSGGTLERPGLQRLLRDVDGGLVDQIVVYKIDRLTRSLTDFAKLVERLDAADASFVSVTQSFNTATSMGRLTLNVLLSFAQFEREVTAERIRDKIAASKKKGLWMGGPIPLGYEPDGRTLRIVEEEAKIVRTLYDLYLECESIVEVKSRAERMGLRSVARKGKRADSSTDETFEGHSTPGEPFARSHIHYILTNPVYAGRIRHRNKTYDGRHPPIIEPSIWEEVQARLVAASRRGRGQANISSKISPLAGKLVDETGDRLTPTHANRRGLRYRYYVSNRLISNKSNASEAETGGWRLPAKPLEQQLAQRVLDHLKENAPRGLVERASADEIGRVVARLGECAPAESEKAALALLACIDRAALNPGKIEIMLDNAAVASLLGVSADHLSTLALHFTAPFQLRKRGVETKLIIGADTDKAVDATLLSNIAMANRYYEAIKQGQTFDDIAASQSLSKRRILQIIDLAFLAPDIVRSIVQGEQPTELTSEWLQRNVLPLDWQAQRRIVATL